MRVLCGIPCLNEDVAIGSVVLRARRHVDEVLVVDDGSTDRTADVARLAGATVLSHATNKGKGEAYATFWSYAREKGFDAAVIIDGDGQHDADEIPLLLERLRQGDDVVIGARWGNTTQMPLWRRVGKRVLDYGTAAAATGTKRKAAGASGEATQGGGPVLTDSQSGFRAYDRKALETIAPHQSGFSVESQLLIDAYQAGLRIGETRIHARYDVDGSTMGSFQHASGILNDLLFQVGVHRPLLYLALPGVLLAMGGAAAGIYASHLIEASGTLSIGWILVSLLLSTIGVLAVFVGVLFNVLPRSLAHALRRLLPKETPKNG